MNSSLIILSDDDFKSACKIIDYRVLDKLQHMGESVDRKSAWDQYFDTMFDLRRSFEFIRSEFYPKKANQINNENVAFIHEDAEIFGDVYFRGSGLIGPGSVLGPMSYLNEFFLIGAAVRLGFGCELKNTILCHGVRIYHHAYVGDSFLGDEVNVGAGTIFAVRHLINQTKAKRGALVGRGVQFGIGVRVMPGSIIPAHKVILPNQVVR